METSKILNFNKADLKSMSFYAISIGATLLLANISPVQERMTCFFQNLLITRHRLIGIVGDGKVLQLGAGISWFLTTIFGVFCKKLFTDYSK